MAAFAISCSAVFCRDAIGIMRFASYRQTLSSRCLSPGSIAQQSPTRSRSLRGLLEQALARPDDGELHGLVGDVEAAALLAGDGVSCDGAVGSVQDVLPRSCP